MVWPTGSLMGRRRESRIGTDEINRELSSASDKSGKAREREGGREIKHKNTNYRLWEGIQHQIYQKGTGQSCLDPPVHNLGCVSFSKRESRRR